MATNSTLSHHAWATKIAQERSVIHTRLTDTIFTLSGIAFFS